MATVSAALPSLPSDVVGGARLALPAPRGNGWELEDRSVIKFSWENVKVLKGKNRERAVLYLAERDRKRCTECNLVTADPLLLNIHHIDGNRENNKRWNLRLADHVCNARLNGNLRADRVRARMSSLVHPEQSERERAGMARPPTAGVTLGDEVLEDAVAHGVVPVPVGTRPWSSREGEKSERMRSSWNTWIRDLENGPFANLEADGAISLTALTRIAVHAIGFGSSQTYEKYALDDHYGKKLGEPGILEVFFDEKGRKMVRYRGPRLQTTKLATPETIPEPSPSEETLG
jgi:5-methylcytosine-specific restriction endonuclease McrA